MPYILSRDRIRLNLIGQQPPLTAGELNYLITQIAQIYLRYHGESYSTYNDIVGALECAKLELYRRKISPYEDIKIAQNGDVYDHR